MAMVLALMKEPSFNETKNLTEDEGRELQKYDSNI